MKTLNHSKYYVDFLPVGEKALLIFILNLRSIYNSKI